MFGADFGTAGNRWPVVRLRAGCECEVVLLSTKFFALTTHWVGHTVPCCGDGCALCESLVARGLFYVACSSRAGLSMLELGVQSAAAFEQHCKLLHLGMRPGQVMRLVRRTAKGGVFSECIDFREGVREVAELDLARRVMALYKFPPPNVGEDLLEFGDRCALMARTRNDQIAERLRRAESGRVAGR